ncbi:Receptor-type tyrosine-protein phosphatase F, partial [Geodia barretti]
MPSGYNISYRNTEYTDCFTKSNTISILTDSLGGNYNIVGLEEGTDYSITVALLMDGAVTDRNTVLQATAEAAPSAPPSEVMVASVTSSTITVVWGEVPCIHQNGAITGYSVQYGVMGSGSTESMAVDGDSSGGMATISGLEAATMYEYQVAGRTSAGPGEYSSTMTTLTSVRAPTVIDSSVGPFSISISWTSSGPVVERYEVEWQRDSSGVCPDEHMGSATVSGGSVRSYDITNLFGDSSYSIRVNATNAAGSAISDPLVVSTVEAAPTAPPASLSSSSVTPSSFSIQWGRVPCIHRNGDITGYSVLVHGNGSMQMIDINDPDVLTTDISGLVSDTMYLVQVAGVNGQGTGVYRDLAVTTPQTVYLNFGGMNLPTNGLVNISQLGNSTDTGLVCSTDQSTDGTPTGGWFNSDGTMLSTSSSEGFFVSDGSDGVYLLRGSGIPVEGIYTCRATDSSGNSRTVFVGLYNEQGGEVVIGGEIGFTLVSELTAEEPQFTLSCNSTDGPATSVIWTRDADTVGGGTTALNDAVAGHYTHTLTVTGRLGGVYICTVSNSISTAASQGQTISVASAPTNLMLIQTDATTIRVTWTPPSPLGSTTGYTVFYSSAESNEALDVREASTSEVELMNLAEGGSYSISLVARSQHLPSPTLTDTLDLVRVPRNLELSVADTTGTSITVSWTVAGGQVESYDIVWGTGLTTEVSGEEESYTIEGLEEGESYTITLTASNAAGSTTDDITASTTPAVYLNFGGMNLPTNGLVNISQLGNSTDTGLVCSTDQSADGTPAGGWFNPDGTMLSSSSSEGFFVSDGSDGVYLLRGSGIPVEGIYTCRATDSSGNSRTVFVGLYNEQGGEVVIGGEIGFTLVSELTAEEPQFTLSCNSTDGPATSVIWTRDADTVGEGTTVLNDAVAAHYTHTLTVTGRLGGVYVCTVSNSISTTTSSGQNIEVASSPTNLMVTQETPTSFRLSWTPPSPLGDTTGYTISYTGGGSSGSVNVAGGSTDSFSLTGLDSGETYTISLIGRSRHIPSAAITAQIVPIPAPGQVFVSVSSITATSISLSWSVSSGRVASWEVVWRPTGRGTESTSGPLSGTTYTILQLDPSTIYTLTVSATNVAGTTDSTPIL